MGCCNLCCRQGGLGLGVKGQRGDCEARGSKELHAVSVLDANAELARPAQVTG
jgi:hypothetical protein